MRFEVLTTPRCQRDVLDIHAWIAIGSPTAADAWIEDITEAMKTLAILPKRYPLAWESPPVGVELRQMLYGNYRVVFSVVDRRVKIHFIPTRGQTPAFARLALMRPRSPPP